MLSFKEALSVPLDCKFLEGGCFAHTPTSPVLRIVPTTWQTSHLISVDRKKMNGLNDPKVNIYTHATVLHLH